MKPIIHQSVFTGLWCCSWVFSGKGRLSSRASHYKRGHGLTPKEAYEEWARINDVNPYR